MCCTNFKYQHCICHAYLLVRLFNVPHCICILEVFKSFLFQIFWILSGICHTFVTHPYLKQLEEYMCDTYAATYLAYADIAYFAADSTFAETFAEITYHLRYFGYDKGLLIHMCVYYINLGLPWRPKLSSELPFWDRIWLQKPRNVVSQASQSNVTCDKQINSLLRKALWPVTEELVEIWHRRLLNTSLRHWLEHTTSWGILWESFIGPPLVPRPDHTVMYCNTMPVSGGKQVVKEYPENEALTAWGLKDSGTGSSSKATKSLSTQTQTSQPNGPGKLLLIKKICAPQLVQPVDL